MICPRCSHQNDEGVRFCVQCGQSLAEVQPPQPAATAVPSQPPAPPAQPAYTPPPPQAYPPPPQQSYPPQAAPTIQGPYPPMPQQGYPYPPPQQQAPYGYPPQQPYGYPPQGGYPPYGAYPGYPPRPQAVETGPWILRSLPFIGSILVVVGFILPWLGTSSFQNGSGFKNLFDLYDAIFNGMLQYATQAGQVAVFIGLVICLTLVPLMGLLGLFSLSGTAKGRSTSSVAGIIGLLAQIGSVIFLLLTYGGNLSKIPFDQIMALLQVGFYLSLVGFIWMLIAPAFAPKPR